MYEVEPAENIASNRDPEEYTENIDNNHTTGGMGDVGGGWWYRLVALDRPGQCIVSR